MSVILEVNSWNLLNEYNESCALIQRAADKLTKNKEDMDFTCENITFVPSSFTRCRVLVFLFMLFVNIYI